MVRAVSNPVLEHFFQSHLPVALGMKAALAEGLESGAAQYAKVVETVDSELGDQLRDGRFGVTKIRCPCILVNGSKFRILVGQNLAEAIGEDHFGVGQMADNLVDTPLIGGWLTPECGFGNTGNGGGQAFGILFRFGNLLLQFFGSHRDLVSSSTTAACSCGARAASTAWSCLPCLLRVCSPSLRHLPSRRLQRSSLGTNFQPMSGDAQLRHTPIVHNHLEWLRRTHNPGYSLSLGRNREPLREVSRIRADRYCNLRAGAAFVRDRDGGDESGAAGHPGVG